VLTGLVVYSVAVETGSKHEIFTEKWEKRLRELTVVEVQQEVGYKHEIFTEEKSLLWLRSSKKQGQKTKFSRRKRAYSG
jgi:hypothetical protein